MNNQLAIAISSGTLKGVFAQGILSAFEGNLEVNAYATASSSVISASLASVRRSHSHGLSYWKQAASYSAQMGMSEVVLAAIKEYGPDIKVEAFKPGMPRLMIAVSKVMNNEAAKLTQSKLAKKLGRKLLIQARRGDSSWVDANLKKVIFDSYSLVGQELKALNFDEVAYASTRMLHEWDISAEIDGHPYVDASYTCSCPAFELIEAGYKDVIVIDSMPGETYESIFNQKIIEQGRHQCSNVHIMRPAFDIKTLGVEYTSATQRGIEEAYQLGYQQGTDFIAKFNQ
jgi:hypothetical protein